MLIALRFVTPINSPASNLLNERVVQNATRTGARVQELTDKHTHAHTHTYTHTHTHAHTHAHTDTHLYTRELRGTEQKNVLMNTRTQRHRIQAHAHKHVRSNLGYVREDSRSDVIAKTKALQAYAGVNRPVTTDLHFSSPGNLKEKQEVKLSPPRA